MVEAAVDERIVKVNIFFARKVLKRAIDAVGVAAGVEHKLAWSAHLEYVAYSWLSAGRSIAYASAVEMLSSSTKP